MKKRKKIFKENPLEIKKGYYVEILSGIEMMLTGCFDITELEETVLRIKNDEHRINIFGKSIEIISYTVDGIRISGVFEKIEF